MESTEFKSKIIELVNKLQTAKNIKDQIQKDFPASIPPEMKEKLEQLDELIKDIETQLSFVK